MSTSASLNAIRICHNVTLLPNASQYNYTCETWNALFTCMATPTHWDIRNGGVYIPYAWSDESFVMPEHFAHDIQTGVLDTQVLAVQVQTWGLVAGGNKGE